MEKKLKEKYNRLINYLKDLESVAVAFSGGVDSTFLLKASKEALGDKTLGITIVSPYILKWEIEEAKDLVEKLGVNHEFLEIPLLKDIKFNPEDRCYTCKKFIFNTIKDRAEKKGIKYVLDGTNRDDTKDYRPGIRALKELNIKSPLLENGFTKEEIREVSKELNLPTWNKPPYACLLSRIPYGEEIKEEELIKIEKAEKYLIDRGFIGPRVRLHKDLGRIELPKKQIKTLIEDEKLLEDVIYNLKGYGFKYVTLDLEGYRMGSLNQDIKERV